MGISSDPGGDSVCVCGVICVCVCTQVCTCLCVLSAMTEAGRLWFPVCVREAEKTPQLRWPVQTRAKQPGRARGMPRATQERERQGGPVGVWGFGPDQDGVWPEALRATTWGLKPAVQGNHTRGVSVEVTSCRPCRGWRRPPPSRPRSCRETLV